MKDRKGKPFYLALVVMAFLLFVLAACGAIAVEEGEFTVEPQEEEVEESQPQPTSTEKTEDMEEVEVEPTPTVSLEGTTVPLEPEAAQPIPSQKDASSDFVVAVAKRDVEERFGIPQDVIEVQAVEEVEWPNAGLGCPVAGLDYAQVITPGYQILLKAEDGRVFDYHANLHGGMVLCPAEGEGEAIRLTPVLPTDPKIQDGEPWVPVD